MPLTRETLKDDLAALLALSAAGGFSPETEQQAWEAALACARDAGLAPPANLTDRRTILAWIGDAAAPHGQVGSLASHYGRMRARAHAAAVLARRIVTACEDQATATDAALARIGHPGGCVHHRECDPAAMSCASSRE